MQTIAPKYTNALGYFAKQQTHSPGTTTAPSFTSTLHQIIGFYFPTYAHISASLLLERRERIIRRFPVIL